MSLSVPEPCDRENEAVDGARPVLAEYVDRVLSPLVALVPWSRRERFRIEVLTHLESLVEDFVAEGMTPGEAARQATKAHGRPSDISNQFLTQWYEKTATGPVEKLLGRATCNAFGTFVMFQAVYFFYLQWRVFIPAGAVYSVPITPAQVRMLWPEPLPFPDGSPWFWVFLGYPLIVPLVAGTVVGLRVPVRPARAVYNALLPLILCSFVVGVLLLPNAEGLLFALVQLAWWLPVGCLSANCSCALSTRSRSGKHVDPDQAGDMGRGIQREAR